MRNILILYRSRTYPMRASQRDHLWAFRRYAENSRCFYVNLTFGGMPLYLKKIQFDLIIFDWSFVGGRMVREQFKDILTRIECIKTMPGLKVTMPQDEFSSMDLLCDLINSFNIKIVFSTASADQWKKIYRTVNFEKVEFIRVLTGYLDEKLVRKWNKPEKNRPIDIGYRTVSTAIWGRFNLLKGKLAEVFQAEAVEYGLNVDIAVGSQYFKMGNDWLKFLGKCRYTVGIEGGSSLLDWDGSLSRCIYAYKENNPDATFEELERECIPKGKDGEIAVVAISPRHLEACLTRTAQVLIEGEYNGILLPNKHYIPLKKDFSNLKEVFRLMSDEQRRLTLVEKAFDDVVRSGKYTYRQMVAVVLSVLPAQKTSVNNRRKDLLSALFFIVNRLSIFLNITFLFFYSRLRDIRNHINNNLHKYLSKKWIIGFLKTYFNVKLRRKKS